MKREGRMLVLILCLLALPVAGVQVIAQEKQTDTEAKRATEAEQLKAKRTVEREQSKAKRLTEAKQAKAKRAAEAEHRKAKRAVEAEQLKKKRATEAKLREMPLDGTFKLLSSKLNAFGRLIKGAPYSATAVTESTHTLSDGNRIIHRDEAVYYRDSEGRTRIEQTLKKIGKWVAAGDPKRIIMIADPVAGYSYYLDPSERKATQAPLFKKAIDPAAQLREVVERQKLAWAKQHQAFEERRAKQKQLFEEQWEKRRRALEERSKPEQVSQEQWAKEKQMFEEQRAKRKQEFDERLVKTKQRFEEQLARQRQGFEGSRSKPSPEKPQASPGGPSSPETKMMVATTGSVKGKKTEPLGKQLVEGVEAEGTRTTLAIPAGEIGNTLPIYVVDERWYSTQLQMAVMTRHHDPRSGETVFRLTNINRSEPARSLFEVPADYTIVENPRAKIGTFPGGPKTGTKPVNPNQPKPPTQPSEPVRPS